MLLTVVAWLYIVRDERRLGEVGRLPEIQELDTFGLSRKEPLAQSFGATSCPFFKCDYSVVGDSLRTVGTAKTVVTS